MRKLLIGLAGMIVLLVTALLIAPRFIDWNSYKGRITNTIEVATGLSLGIDGNIRLAILPSPRLSASGVRVAGLGNSDFVQLEELKVRVGIAALFERRIDVESVTLVKPKISLKVTKDGVANWNIVPIDSSDDTGQGDVPTKPGAISSKFQVSLKSLIIKDGSIHYRNTVVGTDERVVHIDAVVSAVSLDGPFKVDAKGVIRNQSINLKMSAGRIRANQPIPLNVSVSMQEPHTVADFSGTLSALKSTGQLEGKLGVEGTNIEILVAKHAGVELPPYLAGDYSFEATMSATSERVALIDTMALFGESRASGTIDLMFGSPPQVNVVANFPNLDIDSLLEEVASAVPGKNKVSAMAIADSGSDTGVNSKENLMVETPLFELPTNLNARLELKIDAVQILAGIVRDATVNLTLADGGIAIEQATALLPGASEVSLNGFVLPVVGKPKFDGELSIMSDNLRGTIDWLKVFPGILPTDRLRKFSYRSSLKATPDALEVTDISIELDASKISGGLVVALRERPAFGLRLEVDKLNLDPYLKRSTASKDQIIVSTKVETESSSTTNTNSDETLVQRFMAILSSFDANIDARIKRLSVRDRVLEKLHIDTSIVGGKITLREFSVDKHGTGKANLRGELAKLSGNPRANLNFEVNSQDIQKLGRLVGLNFRLPQGVKRKVNASGQISGTLPNLAVNATVSLLGGTVKLDGSIKKIVVDPSFEFALYLNHPNLNKVLTLVAPDFRPATRQLGPLVVNFTTEGNLVSVNVIGFKGKVGPFAIEGEGNVKLDAERPIITANFATSQVLLDLIMPIDGLSSQNVLPATAASTSTSVAPKTGLQSGKSPALDLFPAVDVEINGEIAALTKDDISLDNLQFHLVLKDNHLIVDKFTANTFGGIVQGTLRIDSKQPGPWIVSNFTAADIKIRNLTNKLVNFNRIEGVISTSVELTAAGFNQEQILTTLNGKGSVSGKMRVIATEEEKAAALTGSLIGSLLGKNFSEIQPFTDIFAVLVSSFGNRLAALSGDYIIKNGVFRTESIVLDGGKAQAVTSGIADIPGWVMDTITAVYGEGGIEPIVTATLSGPLDRPNIKFGGKALKPSGMSVQTDSLKKLLPGILGGSQTGTQQQQPSPQPLKKLKPEDLLKDLLKGFGG